MGYETVVGASLGVEVGMFFVYIKPKRILKYNVY